MDPLGVAKHESKEDAYDYVCKECESYFHHKKQVESTGCPGCGCTEIISMQEYVEGETNAE